MSESVPEDFRVGRKVLRMVGELHLRGYQRLRIVPGEAPSGTAWRCSVIPLSNINPWNGAEMIEWRKADAHYTSADGRGYFGWKGMEHATPSALADHFLKRFPRLAQAGRGRDWPYAGWYVEMLQITYPDVLPVAYGDYIDSSKEIPCRGMRQNVIVPPPPLVPGVEAASVPPVRSTA